MPDNTTEKYKKLFLIEADEKIDALNKALLGLEKNPKDSQMANDAMRAAHTIKSSAAAMGFMGISHLAHAMESLFEEVRSEKRKIEKPSINLLFQSVDTLSASLTEIKKSRPEIDTGELVKKLQQGIPGENTGEAKPTTGNHVVEPIEAIKVEVAVLDSLMNLTEELLVERMKLEELARTHEEVKNTSENFGRLLSTLQYNVMEARMVPLGQIFDRFPRIMRDLGHEKGKEIEFNLDGQDIELDRTIIDRLGEPLIHLLRNAVDHGIKEHGVVSLRAKRERDKVLIEVENEGNAINWHKVIDVALQRNIIDKTKRDTYIQDIQKWKSEIEELLYHSELSTKEKVTETSGRGVGLSIVKSVAEALGGRMSIETGDRGTKFTMHLPLTLAIIQALLVRVANQTFALPFSQIDRSVRVAKKNIKKAFDQEVALVEEEDIPLVRLENLFNVSEATNLFFSVEDMHQTKHRLQAELMVITKRDEKQAGIVIDELISEQDIVVKPLKGILKQSKGFAGITLLGDGRPALILDVATLI